MRVFRKRLFKPSIPSFSFYASPRLLAQQNFYEALGVKRTSTEREIKDAYFSLAKKYHPDVNNAKNARDKFEAIQKAYEVLSNEKERDKYDAEMDYSGQSFSQFHRRRQPDEDYEDMSNYDFRTKPRYQDSQWRRQNFWGEGKEDFEEEQQDEFDQFFGFRKKSSEREAPDET